VEYAVVEYYTKEDNDKHDMIIIEEKNINWSMTKISNESNTKASSVRVTVRRTP